MSLGDFTTTTANYLLHFPEHFEKYGFSRVRSRDTHETKGKSVPSILADIIDTPKEYILLLVQVTVVDENTLVIRSNGKRKREDGEEEGCKYLRLERRAPQKMLRKFRLPEDANASAITAECENGVLTVTIQKHPPPPKSSVEVTIA
ncbi:Alpha crystallin/Hsp20 domain [Dillenia turbinata]|uniref:Alpha crystallin/Hsp20 domain n=1 Tax=Dillenia turbinata TaxID=194707 RepID=A0AAN8UFN1_9MAGN